jgi:hypothetical protein
MNNNDRKSSGQIGEVEKLNRGGQRVPPKAASPPRFATALQMESLPS